MLNYNKMYSDNHKKYRHDNNLKSVMFSGKNNSEIKEIFTHQKNSNQTNLNKENSSKFDSIVTPFVFANNETVLNAQNKFDLLLDINLAKRCVLTSPNEILYSYNVWLCFSNRNTVELSNHLCNIKFKNGGLPNFVAIVNYSNKEGLYIISLKSLKNGVNVGEIAEKLFGKGRINTSRFRCSFEYLSKIFIPVGNETTNIKIPKKLIDELSWYKVTHGNFFKELQINSIYVLGVNTFLKEFYKTKYLNEYMRICESTDETLLPILLDIVDNYGIISDLALIFYNCMNGYINIKYLSRLDPVIISEYIEINLFIECYL